MSEEIESWVKNNEFKNINQNIIKEKNLELPDQFLI